MRTWRLLLLATLLAAPRAAHASYFADDLGLSTSQPTPQDPRSGSLSDALSASWDATRELSVLGRLSLIHDDAVAPSSGAKFGQGGGNILLLSIGTDWEAGKHLTLGGGLSASPRSTQYSDSPLTLDLATGGTAAADSLLETQASSLGANLTLTYDTADLDADAASTLDFAFGLNLGATRFSSLQEITRVDFVDKAGTTRTLSVATLQNTYCAKHPRQNICKVADSLDGQATQVTQFPLEASVTATILEDTDVGLGFTYFAYSEDPTQAGFFTVASAGRSGGSLEFGSGLALAPERFVLRPDVGHQFGPVYADVFAEYGKYLDDEGSEGAVGLKVKWKLSAHWKLVATATLSRETPGPGLTADADPTSAASQPVRSSAISGGVRYTF